jgi:glyoxylase-like metal-dependent hydrolase (beta-lactamase superfamily II)
MLVLLAVALAPGAAAQQAADAAVETLHVQGNVYLLASALGNVAIQVGKDPGHDGVLLVDTGAAALTERILAEVRKLTREPVRFIMNTSSDAAHTGGNAVIARGAERQSNDQAAIGVFAHDNVLRRMSAQGAGVPAAAWPTLTFSDGKSLHFNGETVQMFSEAGAHSDGDAIAFFRGSNVISAGDVFLTTGYPVIDLQRGGSIQGEIRALNHIIDLAVPRSMQEGGTMIIPGHGRLCDESDVVEYRDMMTIIRDRVADLIERGKTLEETVAARPSRDYDGRFSTPSWTGNMLVEAIYKSLKSGAGRDGRTTR